MKHTILVADDRDTIQKIVKIYVEKLKEDLNFNDEVELIECKDEKDINDLITQHKPVLTLLDFNLSENKTGYDLSKEIKDACGSKILMMYGTFDTVEESLFQESGVNDHIVKPFDGINFLNQLHQLLEDIKEENGEASNENIDLDKTQAFELGEDFEAGEQLEDEFLDDEADDYVSDEIKNVEKEGEASDEVIIDDDWVVEQPEVKENVELNSEDLVSEEEKNQLEAGMQDWGVNIPPVIGEDEYAIEVPPVIDDSDKTQKISVSEIISQNEGQKLPKAEDLEYPDVEDESSLKLTSLDELNTEEPDEDSDEKDHYGATEIGLDETLGTNSDEEVRELEAQIADEVEMTASYKLKDLWGSDEVEKDQDQEKDIEDKSSMPIEFEATESSEEIQNQEVSRPSEPANIDISKDEIEKRVDEILAPMVERLVQEKVDQIIEKISWEVLPDLAENLIKKELKSITDEVLNSNRG